MPHKKEFPDFANEAPIYGPEVKLPEITLKAIITSIILAVLLGASNAYLALKVGVTVAASIPAAVISLGIFQFFKKSNILENNLVQTAASAGEGLAAATAFIFPALIILGLWEKFNFWQTSLLILIGGFIGVLFSVPLRRVLLGLKALPFPEGTATGNVLKAKAKGGAAMKYLLQGSVVGGLLALLQTGFEIVGDHLPLWFKSKNTLFGSSIGFDPILIGAGYIIGPTAGVTILVGTFFGWIIGIPILSNIYGIAAGSTEDAVMSLWSQHLRYVGVGCMLIAGLWTLLTLLKPISRGLSYAFVAMKQSASVERMQILRTERDIPLSYVIWGMLLCSILLFFLIFFSIKAAAISLSPLFLIFLSFLSVMLILFFGFIFAIVCGYLVGLIGSTNSPISGIFIINVLALSLILLPILSVHVNISNVSIQNKTIAIVIFLVAVIGTICSITLENIQDLRAGYMVGATPWKQQFMMAVGVLVASFAIAPILQLLFQAYGIGGVFPHAGMDTSRMLPAPQAGLLAAVAKGAISHKLPWNMIIAGIVIGIIGIIADQLLRKKNMHLPPLAIGLGIYLPPELMVTMSVAGILRHYADRKLVQKLQHFDETKRKEIFRTNTESSVMIACGLVAGSALMGVILAIPFVLKGSSDALRLVSDNFLPTARIIGLVVICTVYFWLYQTTIRASKK